MTLLPSSSDPFERLHPGIRRWIWQQGWRDLRPIQKAAIPPILEGGRDVIVAAQTAGGKTEAAFLPLLSRIADEPAGGFRLLYISPLKALVNDQFRRLDLLCESLAVPVYRWHGDVLGSHKDKARKNPAGVLLITPESLEATFVRRGLEIVRLFGALDAVVVDELHAFLANERGRQLRSLLHRLEVATARRVTRIGLSATLGDMALAAEFLRPGEAARVALVKEDGDDQELRLQLRGYIRGSAATVPEKQEEQPDGKGNGDASPDSDAADATALHAVAEHLFRVLRGGRHLVFAGQRSRVEELTDLLHCLSEVAGVPDEFFAHHANLSRAHREHVEQRLREGPLPTTAVCTATLELGIDIGDVESVAQIGPPWSVASLRQRLGRSGRRAGRPAVLRLYVTEAMSDRRLPPPDTLRFSLVQAVAMIRLLLERWVEPPRPMMVDLSTLVHQTLALIAERGGVHARFAWRTLCEGGPFGIVPPQLYANVLRAMGRPETGLIEQVADGTLLLGPGGERLVDHWDFYSVFQTAEEYRIVHGHTTLGTLPVTFLVAEGMTIIFAGRRWRVAMVCDREKVIEVEPSKAGRPPPFGGGGGDLDDRVVASMRDVYLTADLSGSRAFGFLDTTAKSLLDEAHAAFARYALDHTSVVDDDGVIWLFPWVGTVKLGTLVLALRSRGLDANACGIGIEIADATLQDVASTLRDIAASPPPDPLALVAISQTRITGKYDAFLTDDLLVHSYASQRLDVTTLPTLAKKLLDMWP